MKKLFKQTLAIVMTLAMIFTIAPLSGFLIEAEASSGTCGENLTWTFNSETGVLDISGTGDMEDYGCYDDYGDWNSTKGYAPWHWGYYDELTDTYTSPIKTINIGDDVTSIGEWAFYECGNVTTVNIGKSVTEIGDAAFVECQSLKSITIPASVKEMVDSPFSICDSLESIKVDPDNKYFSSDSYGVLFNKDKTTLEKYPKGNTRNYYAIPGTVTSIGDHAFVACDNLVDVTIPDSVTSIGQCSFLSCKNLSGIIIPDSVTEVGRDVFSNCDNLKRVRIGRSLTSISNSAFRGCIYLARVEISSSVTRIENAAFNCSRQIKDIYYEGNEEDWKKIFVDINNEELSTANLHYNYSFEDKNLSSVTTKLTSLENSVNGPRLKWSFADTARGYYVYRKTSSTSWTRIGSTMATSFVDKTAKNGKTYTYTAKAYNDISTAKYQSGLTIKYITAPTVSGIVDVVAGAKVSWGKISGAEGYYVYRKPKTVKESSYERIGTTKSTSFVDTTAKSGTNYYYTVRAYSGKTLSSYRSGKRHIYLDAPKVSLVANTTVGIKIEWNKVRGAGEYIVYRKVGVNGTYRVIGSPETTGFLDKNVKSGVTYYYTVRARNIDIGRSSMRSGTKLKYCTKYLTAPTVSSVVNTVSGVKIAWDKITGASGYYVYRKTANGSYSRIGTTAARSFTDKTAKSGTTYYYTVRAYSGSNLSSFRAGSEIKYLASPTVSSVVNTASGVKIAWDKITGASGYYVYRKTVNGSYARIGTTAARSFTDKTAKSDTTYYYTIRAYNGITLSSYKAGRKITRK